MVLLDLGQAVAATQELEKAKELAEREQAKELKVRAMVQCARAKVLSHDLGGSIETLRDLQPLVADNPALLQGVVSSLSLSYMIVGDLEPAVESLGQTERLFAKAPHASPLGDANLGIFKRWQGDFKEGSDLLGPQVERMREWDSATNHLRNLFFYCVALGEQGRYQEAVELLVEGQQFGLLTGERYNSIKVTNSLGWVFHELCLFDKAIDQNTKALDDLKGLFGTGTSSLLEIEAQTRVNLGENYLVQGKLTKSLEALELMQEQVTRPDYFFGRVRWKVRLFAALGELWLREGNPGRAQNYHDAVRTERWVDAYPFKKYQVRVGRLQGNIHAAEGRYAEAEEELKKALALAKKIGNPTQLWRTHQALGNFYGQQKKARQTKTQCSYTLEVVQGIATALTDPALKEGFLDSQPIREVFAQAGL